MPGDLAAHIGLVQAMAFEHGDRVKTVGLGEVMTLGIAFERRLRLSEALEVMI